MKMHQYIRSGGINLARNPKFVKSTSGDHNSEVVVNLFSDCIWQMVQYTYTVIRGKASQKVATLSGGRCEIRQVHVIW